MIYLTIGYDCAQQQAMIEKQQSQMDILRELGYIKSILRADSRANCGDDTILKTQRVLMQDHFGQKKSPPALSKGDSSYEKQHLLLYQSMFTKA